MQPGRSPGALRLIGRARRHVAHVDERRNVTELRLDQLQPQRQDECRSYARSHAFARLAHGPAPILLADVAVASPKNIRPEPGPEKIRRLPEERDSFAFGVHASGGARPCLPSRASVSSQLPREKSLAPKCFENPMSSPEISNSIR